MKSKFVKSFVGLMAIGMMSIAATSAYATGVSHIDVYQKYVISSKANTGMALDIPYGNVNFPVGIFPKSLSKANQQFSRGKNGGNVYLYAHQTVGKRTSNGTIDQRVVTYRQENGTVILVNENDPVLRLGYGEIDYRTIGPSMYRLYFPAFNAYLGVNYAGLGGRVTLQAYNETSDLQKWYIEYGI